MAVELRPLGVACNLGCRYCYQQPQRDAGNHRQAYDVERMRAAVAREGGPFTLFGGEPLLLPLDALEDLLRWGFERYGKSGLQTNGALITDAHVALFARYNVDVGVSIDGPGELNDLRWDATLERTRSSTARTEENIARLCRDHRPPGLIVTLHRHNATVERMPRLLEWMRELDALGVRSVRLHALEVDDPALRTHALDDAENARAFLALSALQPTLAHLRFDVFDELERGLLGRDEHLSCVWRACDPYTTEAVRGVEGNGQASNCGRTNKDGVDFLKADVPGYERHLALQQTPQAHGGCQGCRFFLMCRGQCPGTAIDGDWRNRSELCGLWKRLFSDAERRLILRDAVPLTIDPTRTWRERHLALLWASGRNAPTQHLPVTEPPPPERAGFALPRFLRRAFTGEAQRARWQPRLDAIVAAAPRLAVTGVAAGVVPAMIATVAAGEVIALHDEAARAGLHTRLLGAVGRRKQWHRVAIGGELAADAVEAAWRAGDAPAIDAALALPACCRAAAGELRAEARIDPVVRAAGAGGEVPAAPAGNFLLRPLGIDLLGYAPCSFACAESRARGEALLARGRAAGIEAVAWLEEVLGWPMEWSALHGIAEVKTAIVKLAYATDYTPAKLTLRLRGTRLAPDGARGLTFAYQRPRGLPVMP